MPPNLGAQSVCRGEEGDDCSLFTRSSKSFVKKITLSPAAPGFLGALPKLAALS
jgi:hypothetical protein